MNTHLEAFAQGCDTMERQVREVFDLVKTEQDRCAACLIGGDFNLLASDNAYRRLSDEYRAFYSPRRELIPMLEEFQAVPSRKDIDGEEPERWHTYLPNGSKRPDRTLDYIFFSKQAKIHEYWVRQKDASTLSDHFPVVAIFEVPGQIPVAGRGTSEFGMPVPRR
jgi:endonuclease/exonuclease/phosphatase family metal-dependent hydrolase